MSSTSWMLPWTWTRKNSSHTSHQWNTPLYVHSKSNHPPNIIRNIPESVNRRLSEISSDEALCNEATIPYQDAFYKSGYKYKLEFKLPQRPPSQRRNRSRKIIWFNPPYHKNVKSKIGREFLRLIDKCFPAGHKLRKIFHRKKKKLSNWATVACGTYNKL